MLSTRKLTYSKVYVDSQYRLPSSVSSSDFYIETDEVIETFENTVMYVIDEMVPLSYYTTQEGFFQYLYVILYNSDDSINRYMKIDFGNSVFFASALSGSVATKLDQETNDIQSDLFGFLYDSDSRTMRLFSNNASYKFKILTDKELTTTTLWQGNIVPEPLSINRLLGHWTEFQPTIDWTSGLFNLQPFNSLYIVSPTLSDYHYSAPNGWSNAIIKKINVSQNVGGILTSPAPPLLNDYIDCSNRSFKRLHFKLTDATGKVIPLNNVPISFSLLFVNL